MSIAGAILGVLVSTLALCPPALAGPGSAVGLAAPSGSLAAGSTASGSVKYYIVGPPINDQPEYLFAIATRTLGNGKRADEIFELNKGRRQPDGSALADPAVLHPGWILLLPPDASGPGVLTGPLPTPSADATPGPATTGSGPAEAAGANRSNSLIRGLGVLLVVVVMIVAIQLLRRGRPRRLPRSQNRLRERAGEPAAPDRPDPPFLPASESESVNMRPRVPADGWEGRRAPSDGGLTRPAPAPARGVGSDRRVAQYPPDDLLDVQLTAASGLDRATVRLAGVRLPRATPAWLWLDVDAAGPPAPTYTAVGVLDGRALCLDLVQAPDVLTVAGDEAKARRLSAALARQLIDRGVPVTVVGQAVGGRLAGARMVRSLAEAEAETDDPTAVEIIFCGPGPDDAPSLRRLTARSSPRTIVVLVGKAPPGRWSIEVR
ncbi:hypothetical protein AB0H83_34405 [Dactylosporangium sp. NPDC050688]|uniref:hypothetical protein n=1 Tax=Dactylosporangium sp. NPDC050688 TaxID=3157217 RepID=UPI0033F195FB